MVLVHASETTINCICIGLRKNERTQLADMIQEFAAMSLNELLVPICLLSLTCHDLSRSVKNLQDALWRVQRETGLYGSRFDRHAEDFHMLNFNTLIKRLTSMSDEYARSLSRISTIQRMLVSVEEMLEQQANRQDDGQDVMKSQVHWIKQTIAGSEHYIKWYSKSSSGQVKTVRTYSLKPHLQTQRTRV